MIGLRGTDSSLTGLAARTGTGSLRVQGCFRRSVIPERKKKFDMFYGIALIVYRSNTVHDSTVVHVLKF